MTETKAGIAYDADAVRRILTTEVAPQFDGCEIEIYYGGWSLRELRDSPCGKQLMHQQDWYDQYAWSTEKLPAGIYGLRVPVPNSNYKTIAEQEQVLHAGESVTPVVLVATALLVHYYATGRDLSKGNFTRCKEQAADDNRVVLLWNDSRLSVGGSWDDSPYDCLWVSSVRK